VAGVFGFTEKDCMALHRRRFTKSVKERKMKVLEFIKEFWRDNKFSYLISCLVFSVIGFIIYAMMEDYKPLSFYFSILPLFWIGILIFAFLLFVLIYWRNE